MKQISRQIGCTSTKTGIVFSKELPSLNRIIEGKWPHPDGPQDLNELINGKDDCYFGIYSGEFVSEIVAAPKEISMDQIQAVFEHAGIEFDGYSHS
jgi:hypothetical protein